MSNKACRIDQDAWNYTDRTLTRRRWSSLVRLGLFVVAIGLVAMAAFVALLHVARVIP
jgi:hypothetical protein